MVERIDIDDRFSVGKSHPTTHELKAIGQEGFASVVNLRTEQEKEQPLSPAREAETVRQLGIGYLHYPVSSDSISPELVDGFRERIAQLPGPVFVHCKSGTRSGAFTMMHVASESGMPGDEALRKAKEMGFECDSVELEQFVKDYIDQHRTAS
jgi:uncharacterized protein (TIGR01244 family)